MFLRKIFKISNPFSQDMFYFKRIKKSNILSITVNIISTITNPQFDLVQAEKLLFLYPKFTTNKILYIYLY